MSPVRDNPETHETIVVLIRDGPLAGRIAIIAEIIDHNRVAIS
jgi:ribosomal protein L14E/L6E/L27E